MSANRVTTVLGCPLKAQRRYIQGLPEKPGLGMFRGSMLHHGLEATKGAGDQLADEVHRAWRENAPPPWGGLFADFLALRKQMGPAVAELDQLAEQIETDAKAGRRKGGAKAPRMTADYAQRSADLLRPYTDTIASLRAEEHALLDSDDSPWSPTAKSGFDEYESSLDTARRYTRWIDAMPADQRPEILAVERGFEVPMEEFLLRGRMDALALDPATDALVVIDWKTGTWPDRFDRWVQAAFYAIGAEQAVGDRPAFMRFVNLDEGPGTETYPVRPMWDLQLLAACRWAQQLLEGPPIATLHGCTICSFQRECFGDEGTFQFAALETGEGGSP
jgi:hypothetical protein